MPLRTRKKSTTLSFIFFLSALRGFSLRTPRLRALETPVRATIAAVRNPMHEILKKMLIVDYNSTEILYPPDQNLELDIIFAGSIM